MRKSVTLYCGSLQFNASSEAQETLEALMFWEHCERLERLELERNEFRLKDLQSKNYQDDEKISYLVNKINENKHNLKECSLSVGDMMEKCEKLHIPNWVGNGALQFARDNDLREHYMNEFFTKSSYAKPTVDPELEEMER